ncbi:hypothetical protein CBS101457_002263 [Exobasidium rhododendri]|nr:hypothetical protein CBS101457_002263 [Exobasidium rhododendri]
MPSMADEQLHKILQQIQTQLVTATRQLNMVKAQIQGSENAKRRVELTSKQLSEEQGDVRFWQGIGKMFIVQERGEVEGQLEAKQKEIENEITNLVKKRKFLEKQAGEAQSHMRDIFSGLEQQQKSQSAST